MFKQVNLDLLTIKSKVMEFTCFTGTDVSKNELDFAVMRGKTLLFHKEIANTDQAINLFIKDLIKQPGFDWSSAVFCMEHTGIYNNYLLASLHKKKLTYGWRLPSRSSGHQVVYEARMIRWMR